MRKVAFIVLCLSLVAFAHAGVVVSHPAGVAGNVAFSVTGIGGTPLPTHYTDSSEWDGFSMTWQWTTDEKLDGLGFYIAGTNGITSDQDYLLVIQEMTGTWNEQVAFDMAEITFTLSVSDMTPGWIYLDIDDIILTSNQWYGITLGPAPDAENIVSGQEITWATGSYSGYDGIAAAIDLSGGMPKTTKYEGISADVAIYGIAVSVDENATVYISHPSVVPDDAVFSVDGIGSTPLPTHYYTAYDEWDGISMTWQWTTNEALGGLGFYIAGTNGISSDQDYLLVVQEMTGTWHENVVSNVAEINFTLPLSDMTPGWIYFDIDDIDLVSNQWYGITLGPATDAGNIVPNQEITWATGSWGGYDGIAAAIDLSGGMPRTAEYVSTSADVAIYGGLDSQGIIELSIASSSDSVIVSATGLSPSKIHYLKSMDSLESTGWNTIGGPVTGVYETNWVLSATNSVMFYRVER